jgi:tetratricopeptide (TPR) repeat protein
VFTQGGRALRELDRHREALASFDRAIALAPETAELHLQRGEELEYSGRTAEALAAFGRAAELAPDDDDAHYHRGRMLEKLGRHEEALAAYDRALAVAPDDPYVHSRRGDALLTLGRCPEALAAADCAVALAPAFSYAHTVRGRALNCLGRHEEALAALDQALALDPEDAEAHSHRGESLQALGRCEEALAAYDRALALDGSEADAYRGRALALERLGRHEEARVARERADIIGELMRPREQARPIAAATVRKWMESADPEVRGAVCTLFYSPVLREGITPPLSFDEIFDWELQYYAWCLRNDPPEGEWVHTRWEAAFELIGWFIWYWDEGLDRSYLERVKSMLADLYVSGSRDLKEAIEVGLLEHLFERKRIRKLFGLERRPAASPSLRRCLGVGPQWVPDPVDEAEQGEA